jgi:ketosteroid isomerase-like protein
MSQENVEIVRKVHDAWARGDFAVGPDLLAPDFEWHQFPQAVEPGTRRGAEVGEAFRRMFEVYEGMRVEARELIEADDKVVVLGRASATARGSGMPLDTNVAFVWTVRNGKLVRNQVFMNQREALEAAGLSE